MSFVNIELADCNRPRPPLIRDELSKHGICFRLAYKE